MELIRPTKDVERGDHCIGHRLVWFSEVRRFSLKRHIVLFRNCNTKVSEFGIPSLTEKSSGLFKFNLYPEKWLNSFSRDNMAGREPSGCEIKLDKSSAYRATLCSTPFLHIPEIFSQLPD